MSHVPCRKQLGSVGQHNFFILFSESAPKIYGLSGNLKHFFSWLYLQECRLPLHNARPTLKKNCFPLPDSIKKRGSVEYVISERRKKNSKTCDSERYQFNQLNFFKMLQNNLNLENVEINIIVEKTHLNAKYEFCLKKKKKKKFSFSNHEKLFWVWAIFNGLVG